MTVYIPVSLIVYALVFAAGCLYGWLLDVGKDKFNTFDTIDKIGLLGCIILLTTFMAGLIVAVCGYHVSVLLY